MLSLGFIKAWNDGKFSGDGQARLMANLSAKQHHELASVSEVVLSISELAQIMEMSIASVQVQVSEIAARCGNSDPEWVKAHGGAKCPEGACTCPKMLAIGKVGNRNAYTVLLANFPLAPRYVAPPARPKLEVMPTTSQSDKLSPLAPGKRFLFAIEEGVKEWELCNDNKLPIEVVVTRVGRKCTARLKLLAELESPKNHPAHQGDIKAKTVDSNAVIEKSGCATSDNTYKVNNYVKPADDLRAAVETLRALEWEEEHFSPAFLARITAALGETPVERFVALTTKELEKPGKRNRDGSTKHPSGHLIAFANDAAAAWAKGASKRAAAEAATRAATPTSAEITATERLERQMREECSSCLGAGGKCRVCGGSGKRAAKGSAS